MEVQAAVDQVFANTAQMPSRDHDDWRSRKFLRLFLKGLPLQITTLQIYQRLQIYGTITLITIFENRAGYTSTRAEVTFEPPPSQPFWDYRVVFSTIDGFMRRAFLQISKDQRKNFTIESPLRPDVVYDEKTQLLGTSIEFGVLQDHQSMLTFASRGNDQNQVSMILDLRRKEIQMAFPSLFESQSQVATRTFKFLIAMDDDLKVWRVDSSSYVFHLLRPPWYFKQLREMISQTHSPDAKLWSIEDTWARQTDIVACKKDLEKFNSLPVSLQKNDNTINIARWTTFKFNLLESRENLLLNEQFLNILREYNINVTNGERFKFATSGPNSALTCWEVINQSGFSIEDSRGTHLHETRLPFSVRYQLEVCLSNGWLNEFALTKDFIKKLTEWPESKSRQLLLHLDSCQAPLLDPMTLFTDIKYSKPVKPKRLPDKCVEVCSATVTASSVIFHSPTVEVTNRIVRKYRHFSHHFLRVRFEDDDYRGQTRLYPSSNNKMVMIFQRVKRVLRNGIKLGDVLYEFLAWGNSQLREHGAYFFARAGDVSAESIRKELGDFDDEKIVAKRAARMGQCFSTTLPVHLKLPKINKHATIPDIIRGKYNFTDGVGMISELAATLVSDQLRINNGPPSLFQFRLGGCKGVLAIAPHLRGIEIRVRASQFKFASPYGELEIIRWSEYWHPFLNRQLILCLSSLGVPNEVFLRKQEQAKAALDAAMKDDGAALKALRDNIDPNLMTLSICTLIEAGFRKSEEPFVLAVLDLWRTWSLRYLKEKAKIPVPQGAFVLGTVDETGTLQGHRSATEQANDEHALGKSDQSQRTLPEIFIQITDAHTGKRRVIEGVCVLARNPSLHRGDIRVVMARNIPGLSHLCDVVVMPQTGERDLPSMCSGGDLDGDDYIVIWDQELVPKLWNVEPFHYDPPTAKVANEEITTDDLINFFYDYIQNDVLGRIAHAHLAAADYFDEGLESIKCLELLNLHSIAVDYPKTGVPAKMDRRLEQNQWPHFMKKRGKSYHSHKILGKLYDAVGKADFNPGYETHFDSRLLNARQPSRRIFESVQSLKSDYDNDLQRILAQHNIRTEFEVWSTFVLDHSKASRDYKFHEEVGQLSKALKEQYYEALCQLAGGEEYQQLAPVAVAAYKYCHYQIQLAKERIKSSGSKASPETMPFISFPWVLQDTLIRIANEPKHHEPVKNITATVQNGDIVPQMNDFILDEDGNATVVIPDSIAPNASYSEVASSLPDPYRPEAEDASRDSPRNDMGKNLEPAQSCANGAMANNPPKDLVDSPKVHSPLTSGHAASQMNHYVNNHIANDGPTLGDPSSLQSNESSMSVDYDSEPSELSHLAISQASRDLLSLELDNTVVAHIAGDPYGTAKGTGDDFVPDEIFE